MYVHYIYIYIYTYCMYIVLHVRHLNRCYYPPLTIYQQENGSVMEGAESSAHDRFLYLIPGVFGVLYSVLIFWLLVIFEIVFIYHCVILVPRTTGKETTRSVYGDVIAGICKGTCVRLR
jgi:hypothetical protein